MASATRAASPPAGTARITFYVALAVFAQESTWNFYDNRVPELLRDHIASAAVIGLLMGMDNLLGVFIQPYMGNRSDNTRTAWGRRIPYLAVMMPLGALLSELFGTSVRYTGVSMGYQLAALVGGGFTPLLASVLLATQVRSTPLMLLAAGCGAVTIAALACIRETRGLDLSTLEGERS